jgi:protein-S-isoprenylcysteine O-methyltransferase Ste14
MLGAPGLDFETWDTSNLNRPRSPGDCSLTHPIRSSQSGSQPDWIARWQQVARRIRVPLGFLAAALYLFELWRRAPVPAAVAWSLALVVPGLWLRAYAAGYVKKNRELTVTGPYAYTRNPLYLGSMLIAAGFALALLSWSMALVLVCGFAVIYIPVIVSEERVLRAAFPGFDGYCRRVPRLIPRLTPASHPRAEDLSPGTPARNPESESAPGVFSFALYRKHREYNAVLGAALLYLCLLLLRPALGALISGPR